MRKVVGAAVGGAVLLVGATVGASVWSGRVVTGKLTQQTQELKQLLPSFRVVEQRVSHGLFSSSRTATLELGCVPGALASVLAEPGVDSPVKGPVPIRFEVHDVIRHGPFPGGVSFGAATIDTALRLPANLQADAKQAIGDAPLLALHTVVAFGGGFESTFTLPKVQLSDKEQGSFELSSIVGSVHGRTSGEGAYVMDIPGMELRTRTSEGGVVSFKADRIHSDTLLAARTEPAVWLGPSKATGTVGAIELVVSPEAGALPLEPIKVTFGDIQFSSEATLDKGLWSTVTRYSARGRINDVQLDKLELQASLKRLSAATYQRVMSQLFGTMLSCDPSAGFDPVAGLPAGLQKDLLSLLLTDPEYALDKLAVELGGKRAELSYSFGTRGVTAADLGDPTPDKFLPKLALRGSAAVSLGLVEQLAAKLAAADPGSALARGGQGGPSTSAQTMMAVNLMVDQGVEAGYVTREGDVVKAAVSFEGGELLVNGKPIALPDLPALAK